MGRLRRGRGKWARLLLLLLLLKLRLELLWDRRNRRSTGLEALLLRCLAWEAGELRLELAGALRLLLHAREAGILLLQRSLAEACRLRSKRTWLLLAGLLLPLSRVERASILLRPGPQAVAAAEEGVRS